MFNYIVNAVCSCDQIKPETIARMKKMHDHMVRLYDAAREMGRIRGDSDQATMARLLNVAQQNVNNWESRGLSKEGAIEAQRKLGVSAIWLLYGEGPPTVGTRWPFESIDPHRLNSLSPEQRRQLESSMLTALSFIESDRVPESKSGKAA